jgi:hypothetical protein
MSIVYLLTYIGQSVVLWVTTKKQKNIATAMIRHSLLCHQHCYKRLSNSFTIRTECTELRIKSDVTLLSNPLKATSLHPTSCMVLAHILSVICPIFLRPLWPLIIYFLSYVQPLFEMNVRVLTENYMHPTYQFSVFLGMPQLSSLASPHQNNFSSVFWKTRFQVLDGHHARTKTLFCSMLGWWGAVFALSCLCYHVIMETNESH